MKILNILLVTRGQQRKGTFAVLHHWILTFSMYILPQKVNESCDLSPEEWTYKHAEKNLHTVLEILPPSWGLSAEFPVTKPQHCLVFSVGRFSQGLQKLQELKHQRSSEVDMRNVVTAWTLRSTVHNTPSEVVLPKMANLNLIKALYLPYKWHGSQRNTLKIPWGFNQQNPEFGEFYRICVSFPATLSDSINSDLFIFNCTGPQPSFFFISFLSHSVFFTQSTSAVYSSQDRS